MTFQHYSIFCEMGVLGDCQVKSSQSKVVGLRTRVASIVVASIVYPAHPTEQFVLGGDDSTRQMPHSSSYIAIMLTKYIQELWMLEKLYTTAPTDSLGS